MGTPVSAHGGQLTQTGDGAWDRSTWGAPVPIDLESFNADLEDGRATVDIAIFYPANLEPAHRRKVELDMVLDGVAEARRIFGVVGVQLALVSVRTGPVDPELLVLHAETPGSELPRGRYANLYQESQKRPSRLSSTALAVFETVIGNGPEHDRRIHLVVLEDVFMSFHDRIDERTWQLKTLATNALSFPGYSHRDTIPRHLRGVITLTNLARATSWKTVAHELGHKLINASHEYRDIDPQHEVYGDEGLLHYGAGTDIPSGPDGRFHRSDCIDHPSSTGETRPEPSHGIPTIWTAGATTTPSTRASRSISTRSSGQWPVARGIYNITSD